MTVPTGTMTDEQRKSVALEYLRAFDNGTGDRRTPGPDIVAANTLPTS
jgi:hypothetical protein